MRTFVGLVMLCVLFLIVDAILFDGRYRDNLLRDAKYQGASINRAVHSQLHKLGL
jgi:hypothetical protein